MPDYRPVVQLKRYPYDKIEKDIIIDFLLKENEDNYLKFGTNKYTYVWSQEHNDEIGNYMVLVVSEYLIENGMLRLNNLMKIIPVDKYDRIVQTSEQRRKYVERIQKTQEMQQKMTKAGIKLVDHRAKAEMMPHFEPIGETE